MRQSRHGGALHATLVTAAELSSRVDLEPLVAPYNERCNEKAIRETVLMECRGDVSVTVTAREGVSE